MGGLLSALSNAFGGVHRHDPVDFHTLETLMPLSLGGMKSAPAAGERTNAMTRLGPVALTLALCGAAGVGRAAAQTPACKPVTDAMLKAVTTPHHASDGSQKHETIVADNTLYVLIRGQWRKSPLTPQEQLKQEQDNIRSAKVYACTALRSETVNGVAAVAYKVHSETPDVGTSDGIVWIAPSLGLPVKTEEDITPLAGPRMHIAIVWDYKDIHAPVVK